MHAGCFCCVALLWVSCSLVALFLHLLLLLLPRLFCAEPDLDVQGASNAFTK